MPRNLRSLAVGTLVLTALFAGSVGAAEAQALTKEQTLEFLRTAEVVASEPICPLSAVTATS